ncbi:hypothetical protein WJ973_23310 [Achromobacter xylosoxidans]
MGGDRDAGYLQSLTDCAGVDDCVASQARDRITEGYDVVVAQFGAAERAAASAGFGEGYRATLRQADSAIGALLEQVADRRAAHPDENWLVVVASSHGLDRTGGSDGLPLSLNKTTLLALNRAPLLGGSADDAAVDGVWDTAWYGLPSAADAAPTLLAHLGALPAPGQYDMAGTSLFEAVALRRGASRTSMDNKSVSLSWSRVGTPTGEIVITRDAKEIARLPGTATDYVDTGFTFTTEGVHELNYAIAVGGAVTAVRATVVYTAPVPLLPSLSSGLTMLFPFEGNLTDKAAGGGVITPYDGVQAPAFADKGVFGKMFRNERGGDPIGAFKLDYPAGLLDSVQAFTIGFWYQSDGTANDRSILGNKDYNSGANPGITIAQWAGPELRFNLAGGSRGHQWRQVHGQQAGLRGDGRQQDRQDHGRLRLRHRNGLVQPLDLHRHRQLRPDRRPVRSAPGTERRRQRHLRRVLRRHQGALHHVFRRPGLLVARPDRSRGQVAGHVRQVRFRIDSLMSEDRHPMNTANPILRACLRMGAALMVAAVLTACGGDKDDDDDAGNPGNQPETPTQPAKPQLRCAP